MSFFPNSNANYSGDPSIPNTTNSPLLLSNQIYTSIGKSQPLELGFTKGVNGTIATRLASPPPTEKIITVPPPIITSQPYFEDVVTKSMIPKVSAIVTASPIKPVPGIITPVREEEISVDKETPVQGISFDEMNQRLYDILTQKGEDMSCACDSWEFYRMSNPSKGIFTWKTKKEFIYKDVTTKNFEASDEYQIAYSRWGGASKGPDNRNTPKLILLHDLIENQTAWWCVQRLLSPFFEVVVIDLLGSGESTKPRGFNQQTFNNSGTSMSFNWSFLHHAEYIIGMARNLWPGEKFFVAGVGWGAQIASYIASISTKGVGEAKVNNVEGVILINPPNFSTDVFPELGYSELYHMAKIISDDELCKTDVSLVGLIRNIIINNLNGGVITPNELKLITEQYNDHERKRILLDQLIFASNNPTQVLPKTADNQKGLAIERIISPVLVVTSGKDMIYSASQRHFYPAVFYNSGVSTIHIPDAGHFIHIEKPKEIAEIIINFIRNVIGFPLLGDAFVGFSGASQGNERVIVKGFKMLYEME